MATTDDVADYFRIHKGTVRAHLESMEGIEQVSVETWGKPAWALPALLKIPALDREACTPLSPFDSLVWHRPRALRLFGVDYLLEAYKPASARQCGYFGMPVLRGSQISGRIALRVTKGTARLEGHQLAEHGDPSHLHHAVQVAASWAGAHTVEAESNAHV